MKLKVENSKLRLLLTSSGLTRKIVAEQFPSLLEGIKDKGETLKILMIMDVRSGQDFKRVLWNGYLGGIFANLSSLMLSNVSVKLVWIDRHLDSLNSYELKLPGLFWKKTSLIESFKECHMYMVPGGDPQVFMRVMNRNENLKKILVSRVRKGECAYVSRSAGTIVAGSYILSGETRPKCCIKGLHLIKYALRPHYNHKNRSIINTKENKNLICIPNGKFAVVKNGMLTTDGSLCHPQKD